MVSWSGYSSATGGGSSVNLAKNRVPVAGTTCTWALQGRSIVIDFKKGDILQLRYVDFNDYGYDRISFCVNLEHAHNVKSHGERGVTLVPSPDKIMDGTKDAFYLKLRPTNRHFNEKHIQNMDDTLESNVKSDSKDCKESIEKRTCEETCNNFGFTKCDPGCKFDLDLLGECKTPPYGYFNTQFGKAKINPCFYLKFETNTFTNISEPVDNNTVRCRASLTLEESNEVDFLPKMKQSNLSSKYKEEIDFFIENKEIFKDMAKIEEDKFRSLVLLKAAGDGLNFLKKTEFKFFNKESLITHNCS